MPRRKEATPFLATLGSHIRDVRLAQDLSLDRVADVSKLSKGNLSSIEHGRVNITVHTFMRIAEGLRVEPAQLLPPREAKGKTSHSGKTATRTARRYLPDLGT